MATRVDTLEPMPEPERPPTRKLTPREWARENLFGSTLDAILTQDPPPLTVNDAALGPGLTTIVEHCLEKEPASRFQSAQDLAFNLDALRGRSDRASGSAGAPPVNASSIDAPSRYNRSSASLSCAHSSSSSATYSTRRN